jgi:RNA polymerase sigma factor (sigma-70 family)
MQEVHPHDAALRSYVRGSFSGLRDLDDVVQESYLRVWKRQATRPIASIRAFLFAVARNLALDTLRRERISPLLTVTESSTLSVIEDGPGCDELVSTRQEYALALEAIDLLPARCREVVILRKIKGLSPSETAEKLGISEETVHVQARRGLRRIQEFLVRRQVRRGKTP